MRRLVFLSLLVIALVAGTQSLALAKATKVDVEGWMFLGPPPAGSPMPWTDGGGDVHLNGLTRGGTFHLEGDGIDFEGTRIVELYGVRLDGPTGDGHVYGPVTVYDNAYGQPLGNLVWEGRMHVTIVDRAVTGELLLHGVGAYEGTRLKLHVEKILPPAGSLAEWFAIEGELLDPRGE